MKFGLSEIVSRIAPQWQRNRAVAREQVRMMGLSGKFFAAAQPGINRPAAPQLATPEDYKQAYERIVMIRYGRQMEDDIPYIESILSDFETYVVGDLRYRPNTGNREADKIICEYLEWQFGQCDNAGELDLTGIARLSIRSKKRDGEIGLCYVEKDDSLKLALVEADCIGNPLLATTPDPLDFNGIVVDKHGAPQRYVLWRRRAKMNSYEPDTTVQANHFIHFYDKYRVSQKHGITAFKNGITRAIDLEQTIQFAIQNIKFRSSQLPAIQNETGKPKVPGSGYVRQNASSTGEPQPFEVKVSGVTQHFLKLEEGYVEYPHDFPNANFRDITSDLKGDVALGVHLPAEFCFRSEAGGVLQRFYIEKAQRTFDEEKRLLRRTILDPYKNRVLRKAVDAGFLNLDKFPGLADSMNLYKGAWHMGRSVSTDYGHDTDSDIKLIDASLMSPEEHAADNARDLEEIRENKKLRAIEIFEDAAEIAQKTGRTFEEALPFVQKQFPNPASTTGGQKPEPEPAPVPELT
jgi:hypothetical protein